jgi:AAA+ superfamily predicted ATPase
MSDDTLLDQLRAALAASPDNLTLRFLVARRMADAGRKPDAVALLDGLRPEGLDAGQAAELAGLLLDAGAPERARQVVEATREKGRNHARHLHATARVSAALGDWRDAQRAWLQAREIDPALADPELEQAIQGQAPGGGGESRPPLRIVVGGKDEREVPLPLASEKPITFADVGGYDDLKKLIHRKIILPFQKPELFARYGRQAGGGILLFGPPGCGKTLLARATAGECGASFMNVAIEDVLDMWKGESERKLHALFQQARERAPTVMFFDEIEALGGKRSATLHNESGILISLFLSEMDGFGKSNQRVLIIGATNVPWAVDPAFRRPGRFDNVIFVPPPDRAAREAILALQLAARPVQGINVTSLAAQTTGFSGADLKHLIESGIDLVIEHAIQTGGEPPLTMEHLKAVLPRIKSTTTEWLSTARNYAMYSNEGGQYDDVLAFLKQHGR